MKNLSLKIKSYWLLILLVIVVAAGAYFVFFKNNKNGVELITVAPGEFTQMVSVSGKVIPAKSVELGFNKSGRVAQVPVIVGEGVGAGQIIASLDSRDAALSLENAKIELKKMIENSNLSNQGGLSKDDETSLAGVDKAYLDMATIFDGLNPVLNNYQVSTYKNNLPSDTARNYYQQARTNYFKAYDSYNKTVSAYRQLKRPLSKTEVAKSVEDAYNLAQTLSQAVNDAYTYISFVYDQTSEFNRSTDLVTDKENIAAWRSLVNAMIPNLSTGRSDLKDYTLNIESQKVVVAQKENDYQDYFLRAPFAGIVTRLDIKTGEQAIAGQATVTMINSGLFQIESFVPEINIANLKLGNPAEVTLDAYGEELVFAAKIISIDPAETIHDGVSTYKVKLQFSQEDARIKPGMTANLLITALKKDNVISVPVGAIITKEDKKFVKVKVGEQVVEREVKVGERGVLGQTEILSGLKTGEQVVLNSQAK